MEVNNFRAKTLQQPICFMVTYKVLDRGKRWRKHADV
jgi:hypothetical protein